MYDGFRAGGKGQLLLSALVAAAALVVPSAASGASYDRAFHVTALRGGVTADITLTQRPTQDAPEIELYGGTGSVTFGLQPPRPGAPPTGRLRWNPGTGGTIAVVAALRFSWNESAGRGDSYGPRRRCQGRTTKATPRRMVHVLAVERRGDRVRVRWAIPLPRLGQAGCAGAGKLPKVSGVDVYPASTFDHQQVRIGVQGSDRLVRSLSGRRVRTTTTRWDFTITLQRA